IFGKNPKGPIPNFFKYLEEIAIDQNLNGQHTLIERYQATITLINKTITLTPSPPSSDGRRKEWIITRDGDEYQFGKILKKNLIQFSYQHWIRQDNNNLITKCVRCSTNSTHIEDNPVCVKKEKYHKSTIIDVKCSTKDTSNYEILTPVDLIKMRIITKPSWHENESPFISLDIPSYDLDIIKRTISSIHATQIILGCHNYK
ncbi:hypothetical protein RhiirA1_485652, partial [Rhizophagus irregularis]